MSHLEQILDADFLTGVERLDIKEVRRLRAACKEIETGLSYLRRVVQGRIDIVQAERARRAEGGTGDDLEDLIARLPALLADRTRTPGSGRPVQDFGTGDVDPGLQDELDHIASPAKLGDPTGIPDDQLDALHQSLQDFETRVSGLRRQLFDRIDGLENELTRRYRTGEASVDSLLH